jgi:hypothetical protein
MNELALRLSDISQRFEQGALSEFSNEELYSLVSALFADTEKRADILKRFRQK